MTLIFPSKRYEKFAIRLINMFNQLNSILGILSGDGSFICCNILPDEYLCRLFSLREVLSEELRSYVVPFE